MVSWSDDGEKGLHEALNHRFDIVLLDIMLPKLSGIEVCQSLRKSNDVPIIMITARDEEADRVLGLEVGADDYVSKPFSPRELLARIRAQVRRNRGNAGPKIKIVTSGDLEMNPGTRKVTIGGDEIDLTSYEFSLLFALVERAGMVLSRERVMELARGNAEEAYDRSIDVHISRIRQKIEENSKTPKRIKTIRGVGYQYVSQD